MTNKTLSIFLIAVCFLFQFNIVYGGVSELPDGWSTDTTSNGSVEVEDGIIRMIFDSTLSSSTGRADVTTDSFLFDGTTNISFDFTMKLLEFHSYSARTLILQDNNNNNNIELLGIRNKSIKLFGVDLSHEVGEKEEIHIKFAFDLKNSKSIVWINGEKVFVGTSTSLAQILDISNLSLRFRNAQTVPSTVYHVWEISNFNINYIGPYSFSANVQNNEYIRKGEISKIEVDFGTQMSEGTYQKNNIALTRNGIPIDFTAEKSDCKLIITPDDEFDMTGTYEVMLLSLIDIFGNEKHQNKSIAFTIVDAGFEFPEVSINANEIPANMKEGEGCLITAVAQAQEILSLDIVINSQIVRTTKDNTIMYYFTPTQGIYEIYAVVHTEAGVSSATEIITVSVQGNNGPFIEVSGLVDGIKYDINSVEGAEISATDADGISQINVYLNNMLIKSSNTSEFYLELNGLSYGDYILKIEAYDIYNAKSQKEIQFSVTGSISTVLFTENFEGFTSEGMTLSSGIRAISQRGYVRPMVIDERYNISAAIGMDTVNIGNPPFNPGDRPFLQIPVTRPKSNFIVKYDLYVDKAAASDDTFIIQHRKTSTSTADTIALLSGNIITLGGKDFECKEKTWYTLTVDTDIKNRRFSATFYNNETGDLKAVQNVPINNQHDEINLIRILGPRNDKVITFMAIDNFEMKERLDIPTIVGIGYSGLTEIEKIDYKTKSIDVYLSSGVVAQSVNVDNIDIYCANEKIAIKRVTYNPDMLKITIDLEGNLRSNTSYNVVLNKNISLSTDYSLGADVHKSFLTSYRDYEVIDVLFKSNNGKVSIDTHIANTTGTEKELLIIASIWKGDEFKESRIFTQKILPTTALHYSFILENLSSGETLEIYVWDNDGHNRKMIANKIYRYVK